MAQMTDRTDRGYMLRAIELAKRGRGWVNPNPLVGAVIVKNGRIIGEGFHERYGEPHAERNAIKSLTESAKDAALYVTLEPCCHYGKTPPCTEAILEQGIGRVVIGSRDPNPKVAGRGVKILRDAGVRVEEDFMREECDRLNPVFFHYITAKTPYVVMKYAMTADGKIATRTGASKWVTGRAARLEVQHMRSGCMGIMVGIGTVLADDPMLNVRLPGRRAPVRIICDSRLRLPPDSQICRTAKEQRTIVACAVREKEAAQRLEECGVEVACLPETCLSDTGFPGAGRKVDLRKLMEYLGGLGIDSILLEGGGELNEGALRAGIVQEVKVFIAPKLFGGAQAKPPVAGTGVELPAQAYGLELNRVREIEGDILLEYSVTRRRENGAG